MGEIKLTLSLENALNRIVGMLMSNEATAFVASEFLISHEIQQNLAQDTKFARALSEAEISIRQSGFEWWEPPLSLRQIIEITRSDVQRVDHNEAIAIVLSLLTEKDPASIRNVKVN